MILRASSQKYFLGIVAVAGKYQLPSRNMLKVDYPRPPRVASISFEGIRSNRSGNYHRREEPVCSATCDFHLTPSVPGSSGVEKDFEIMARGAGIGGWSLLFVQSRVYGVGKRYGVEAEEDTGLGTRTTALTAFDLLPWSSISIDCSYFARRGPHKHPHPSSTPARDIITLYTRCARDSSPREYWELPAETSVLQVSSKKSDGAAMPARGDQPPRDSFGNGYKNFEKRNTRGLDIFLCKFVTSDAAGNEILFASYAHSILRTLFRMGYHCGRWTWQADTWDASLA